MRKFFPSLFFACFVSIVLAQNNLSRVYAITTDTALIGTLTNNYWQMLEDKDGKSPIADKFHYDSLSYDIIKGAWWRNKG